MPTPPLDWRTEIATQVCTLVRDERVMARFRAMGLEFLDEKRRDEGSLAAWKQRRKEYCQRGLITLDDFKARTAETERLGSDRDAIEKTRPPEDAAKVLVHDYYQDHLSYEDAQRLGDLNAVHMLVGFCVWVPRELSLARSPELTVPDVLARFLGGMDLHSSTFGRFIKPGVAGWPEKYSTLAVIHDAVFPERAPIDCHWESHRNAVFDLTDENEASIREWLVDVESDLATYLETLDTTTRKEGKQDSEDQFADGSLLENGRACAEADKATGEMRWLSQIADLIHELTRDDARKARFAQLVLSWAKGIARDGRWKGIRLAHYLRGEHPEWSEQEIEAEIQKKQHQLGGIPFKFREDPINLTIHSSSPTEKKFADFAAIHDKLHKCGFPISPWKAKPPTNPFRDDASDEEVEYYVAETCFQSLQEDVVNLTDDDRSGIDRMLEDISAHLPLPTMPGNVGSAPAEPEETPKGSSEVQDATEGFFSAKDLSKRHRLSEEETPAFRKRLERWRQRNVLGTDWVEADRPARNEDRFLYRESAVQHLIRKDNE